MRQVMRNDTSRRESYGAARGKSWKQKDINNILYLFIENESIFLCFSLKNSPAQLNA
jgi:hypothetical protein